MSDINKPITFSDLLQQCRKIEVPLIQRDYAQGRDTQKDVRDEFLKALHAALSLPADSSRLPLNLDFVYGSMEDKDKKRFLPLDGQQRLTTLFLLHWYLAWQDGALPDFRYRVWDGAHARFTYGVRPSSTEFFDELARWQPPRSPESVPSVRRLLQDQHWFFLYWRLDPTIQSSLTMLDAIHERFKAVKGLYARLVDQQKPVITFQLLPLEHFGLTDDLYIKMNARGKPLTAFETFKARFEELLKDLFPKETRTIRGTNLAIHQFFAMQIDAQWTDFFWHYKDEGTNTFDDALMNLLWVLIRVCLNPAAPSFAEDTTLLRNQYLPATYTHFHERGWLTRDLAEHLICLLETWSKGGGPLARQLPDTRYFDEQKFFESAIGEPAGIEYTGLVMFAGFLFYLRQNDGSLRPNPLSGWMRVVFNLAQNSDIERPEQLGRCLAGLQKLLPHSLRILERLAEMETEPLGFSPQQVREEMLKAQLVLSHPGWRQRVDAAERHGYFCGRVEFLLDFSGVSAHAEKARVQEWGDEVHIEFQAAFDRYLQKAQLMFDSEGLVPTGNSYLWKRALLATGDYLLRSGRNDSFLTNAAGNWDSWRRLLGDIGSRQRGYLKALWDRIDATAPVEPQLSGIISGASGLEPWRAAIVKHPELIDYCGQQEIRREQGANEIYLLRRRQMNGDHAELFSYALYQEISAPESRADLEPLKVDFYRSVSNTETEPRVWLSFSRDNRRVRFGLCSWKGGFCLEVLKAGLADCLDVEASLKNECGFSETDGQLARWCSRDEIRAVLRHLANRLAALAGPNII